jgi:RNA polymerase sigma-70 factor (ECF subfamily)
MTRSPDEVARLLTAARGGSEEALGKVFDTCRDYLLHVAERRLRADLRSKGGASDLVQQTFLDAHRDFAQFQGKSEEQLLAWLRQILVHNLAHFHRSYRATAKRDLKREVPLPGATSASDGSINIAGQTPTPSQQVVAREEADSVQQALERLPEECRQVLTLRHKEQRTFEEIGHLMGRSTSGARTLWLRAVELLDKELGKSP